MTSSEQVLFQLIYIIPSIILYIMEIYVMFFGIHKSRFNTASFNKLFAIYAVNNVIAEILNYFFLRMGSAPVFFGLFERISGTHLVLALFWQLYYHTMLVNILVDFVLSINRFTAVLIPLRYKHFWDDKIKWIVICMIVVPYICFWPFPFEKITIMYNSEVNQYHPFFGADPPILWPYATGIIQTCTTVTCISCLLFNIFVGFKLHRKRNIISDSNYQQEKVYFFFTICVFVNQLFNCASQVDFKTFQNKS